MTRINKKAPQRKKIIVIEILNKLRRNDLATNIYIMINT